MDQTQRARLVSEMIEAIQRDGQQGTSDRAQRDIDFLSSRGLLDDDDSVLAYTSSMHNDEAIATTSTIVVLERNGGQLLSHAFPIDTAVVVAHGYRLTISGPKTTLPKRGLVRKILFGRGYGGSDVDGHALLTMGATTGPPHLAQDDHAALSRAQAFADIVNATRR